MVMLAAQLQTVRVDEPLQAGNLQVFGLRWEPGDGPNYITLDDALAAGMIEVTEVGASGSVPTLKVTNKGDVLAFLMAGEQLAGGKQNRVLNASILVAAHSELPIPVSCVERGRWAYRGPRFGSSGSSSHGKLRKLMHMHATESYRSIGTPSSKQGEVWQEVDRKLSETGSHSSTAMLEQAYLDTQTVLAEEVGIADTALAGAKRRSVRLRRQDRRLRPVRSGRDADEAVAETGASLRSRRLRGQRRRRQDGDAGPGRDVVAQRGGSTARGLQVARRRR